MSWLTANWKVLVSWLFSLVLQLIGKKDEAEAVKTEAEAIRTKRAETVAAAKVMALETDRAVKAIELKQNAHEAAVLDKAIADARRKTVEVTRSVDGMNDEEVLVEFKRLGYY